jgi:NADPH-dependent curcumin reductase CurA
VLSFVADQIDFVIIVNREAVEFLSQLLLTGKLKYAEHIIDGLENAPAG